MGALLKPLGRSLGFSSRVAQDALGPLPRKNVGARGWAPQILDLRGRGRAQFQSLQNLLIKLVEHHGLTLPDV